MEVILCAAVFVKPFEDYSFKYLGCVGKNTNRAIIFLFSSSFFLKVSPPLSRKQSFSNEVLGMLVRADSAHSVSTKFFEKLTFLSL